MLDKVEEVKKFLILMNRYDASIYRYVYAKKVNYDIDPKYSEESS